MKRLNSVDQMVKDGIEKLTREINYKQLQLDALWINWDQHHPAGPKRARLKYGGQFSDKKFRNNKKRMGATNGK